MRLQAVTFTLAAAALALPAGAGAQAPGIGIPAQVVDTSFTSRIVSYPMTDYGISDAATDDRDGTTAWRVVSKTGNCCEQHLLATKDGRLLDFGGSYINYTDDRGLTWKSVRPQTPLLNGEGTIVEAPGGDILGMEWDPYSGDHLLSFKYDAAAKSWQYAEAPAKTPVYDREWIAVVPGPFSVNGQTYPWASFYKGGTATKDPWFVSFDGLLYVTASSPLLDEMQNPPTDGPLPIAATPDFDLDQPTTNSGITPLGKGAALAAPQQNGNWGLLSPSLSWSAFTFPGGTVPEGAYQVDSGGRLHNVVQNGDRLDYRISSDGGKTWHKTEVRLPKKSGVENYDFHANKALGLAAIAIHAHDGGTDKDVDYLIKLDISGDTAKVIRRYRLGLADANGSSGLGASVRIDFVTVALLPDGRAALTVFDSKTISHSLTAGDTLGPELAIEGDTTLPPLPVPPTPAPVKLKLTLKATRAHGRLTVSGRATPAIAGAVVVIERRAGKRFVRLGRTRLSRTGTYRFVKKYRKRGRLTLRARVSGDATHLSATSPAAVAKPAH